MVIRCKNGKNSPNVAHILANLTTMTLIGCGSQRKLNEIPNIGRKSTVRDGDSIGVTSHTVPSQGYQIEVMLLGQ